MQKSKIDLATQRVIGGEASMGVGERNQFGKVGCGENPMAKAVLGEAVRGKLDSWRTLMAMGGRSMLISFMAVLKSLPYSAPKPLIP